MRVQNLKEFTTEYKHGSDWGLLLGEFLDEFYAHPDIKALESEPELMDEEKDAYIAAIAEHLARRFGWSAPDWTKKQNRFLHKPLFVNGGLESLKALLLVQSPVAFRRRMIFVDDEHLSRV
ncbi:MAG: hypothetical protein WCP79_08245 [Bacillota bacterium]